MYKQKKISVIMPCRNEGAHLSVVAKRIPAFVDEIIIVSNKSTDNTVEAGRKLGLTVLEDNRTIKGIGYGFAHMTGIKAATGDIIAGIDGDATYPIEDLSRVIDHLLTQKLDFISCNRYPIQDDTKIPFKLRLGVFILNLETRILYGIKINDILSGMWVFTKQARPKLKLTMGDWNLSPQIKINAATSPTIRFGEYSIAQHQREGETKQRHFATGMSHLKWIFKNRLASKKHVSLGELKTQHTYRFVVVGTIGFIFNSCLLLIFTDKFKLGKVLSEAIAMILALQLTFALHDRWTYVGLKERKNYHWGVKKRYTTYLFSNSFGSLLTIALFAAFSQFLPRLAALAIAALISMIWNYLMNKAVIWRHKPHDSA